MILVPERQAETCNQPKGINEQRVNASNGGHPYARKPAQREFFRHLESSGGVYIVTSPGGVYIVSSTEGNYAYTHNQLLTFLSTMETPPTKQNSCYVHFPYFWLPFTTSP